MSFNPGSSPLFQMAQSALESAWASIGQLFGQTNFSADESLINTPNIDPHFIPKVPMSNANLDVHLLGELGRMGMKRGKEITAQTHPELYQAWQTMCMRAHLGRVPQMILAESKVPNAASLSGENAIVVTTGLLKRMNLREVRAVLGHELGHESSDHKTPRGLSTVLFGGGGLLLGNMLANRGGLGAMIKDVENPSFLRRAAKWVFGGGPGQSSVLAAEIYMAAGALTGTVIANQVSVRPTELDADHKGAIISGDPEGLISALNKLEDRPNKKPFFRFLSQIQSGYPSTQTRIRKLREFMESNPQVGTALPMPLPMPVPQALASDAPGLQVSGAALAEERMGAPVQPALGAS